MKFITISISVFTLTAAIRVPTTWTPEERTNNNRQSVNSLTQRLPIYVARPGYQPQERFRLPPVAPQAYVVPRRRVVAANKKHVYINNIRRNPRPRYPPRILYSPSSLTYRGPPQEDWVPVARHPNSYPINDFIKQPQTSRSSPNQLPRYIAENTPSQNPEIQRFNVELNQAMNILPQNNEALESLGRMDQNDDSSHEDDPNLLENYNTGEETERKPVYQFDSNFNLVTESSYVPYDPFAGGFQFAPLPQSKYTQYPNSPIYKNYRDDKTHEPVEASDESERISDEDGQDKENIEESEKEEEDEEEERSASISEHENPAEVPTRPIYPGEGKWAQRGVKHRPYINNHKYEKLQDDEDEKPEGYDVFQKAGDVFQRQSERFQDKFAGIPRKNKQGHYFQPPKEEYNEDSHKEGTNEEEEEEFVPVQVYSQVRKSEDEEHLPPIYEGPQKLREVIKDSKIQTVYTEEGYEDIAYDHAGHEKEASEKEGFAEAEKEVQEEKLKKAPKHRQRLVSPDDSAIEESNYANAKVVLPNNPNGLESGIKRPKTRVTIPKMKNDKNFVKTQEVKTTSVKDTGKGMKELEILSEIKVMMTPNNGTKTHKYVKIFPKVVKYEKDDNNETSSNHTDSNSPENESGESNDNSEELIITTVQPDPSSLPDLVTDEIPIPPTTTQALPLPIHDENPDIDNPFYESLKLLKRSKRFTNDFHKVEVDTDFIDKINHDIPAVVDRTNEKYPYYFLKGINKNSPLRYSENLKNVPVKKEGELNFYEQAQNNVPCEEVESDVDPIPDRVKNADKNAEEMEETKDVADLAPSPRLRGLGDKIQCFKKRYFGENPLDSPFFKEELVDPVTPPYKIEGYKAPIISSSVTESKPHKLDTSQTLNNKQSKDQYIPWLGNKKIQRGKINLDEPKNEDDEGDYEENASNISQKSSENQDDEPKARDNEIDSHDAERVLKENLEDLNNIPEEINGNDELPTKEDYNHYEQNDDGVVKSNESEINSSLRNQKTNLGSENGENVTPAVGGLVTETFNNTETNEEQNRKEDDKIKLNILQDIIGNLNAEASSTENNIKDHTKNNLATSTISPDAEIIDVDQLPEPTRPPTISIITTPNYTIDLQPKHIYDQIKLLKYLPDPKSEEVTPKSNEYTPDQKLETTTQKINQTEVHNTTVMEDRTFTVNASKSNSSREARKLSDAEDSEQEDVSKEVGESEDKPENSPLKRRRRKFRRRRKPMYQVFDVTKFWPTTPTPIFKRNAFHRTVLPKHKVHSEVHYKDEIKPSEQLNVFADVLKIIQKSSKDPLIVSETQNFQSESNNFHTTQFINKPVTHNVAQKIPVTQNFQANTNNFHQANYPYSYYQGEINDFHEANYPKKVVTYNVAQPVPTSHKAGVILKENLPVVNPNHRLHVTTSIPPITPNQNTRHGENEENDELIVKLKKDGKPDYPVEEQDEIDYYTNQDLSKVDHSNPKTTPVPLTTSTITYNNKKSSPKNEESIDYIQEPLTEVLGLVPPGKNQYRTIYKPKHQKRIPTSIYSIMEESDPKKDERLDPQVQYSQPIFQEIDEKTLNKYYVLGMKPPPKQQKIHLYSDFKLKPSPSRRIMQRRRYRRAVKPSYTPLVRSRGPQFEGTTEPAVEDDDDDYVPHRPKNYHYDVETGRIVYDNKDKTGKDDEKEEEVEYEEIEEVIMQKPKKSDAVTTSTISWIATAKPNKDEPSLLYYIQKLKSNPNYIFIPDPTTTVKSKLDESTTPKLDTTTVKPKSTSPPPFLNILAKIKADSNYKLIPDKTTAKPKPSTTTEAQYEEVGEALEESKIENSRNSPDEQQAAGDFQIFDISEFLPKTKDYQPRTSIDYSKYKTIDRGHVNTRHNLSSRYNAENDKLEEVNTKKVPLTLAKDNHSIDYPAESESRVAEMMPSGKGFDEATSTTDKSTATTINVRRKAKKTRSTAGPSSTTKATTEAVTEGALPSSSSSTTSKTTTASIDVTSSTPAITTTRSTTVSTTVTSPTSVASKRMRIRSRGRSTTARSNTSKTRPTSSPSSATTATTKRTVSRRRPARIKIRTTTEKFINEDDVESKTKVVRRRHQSESSYVNKDSEPETKPFRLAPIIVADVQEIQPSSKKPEVTTSKDLEDNPKRFTVLLPLEANTGTPTSSVPRKKRIRNSEQVTTTETPIDQSRIPTPPVRRRKPEDSKPTQTKKVDVEVYKNYNLKQKHGGNYKAKPEIELEEIEVAKEESSKAVVTEKAEKNTKDLEIISKYDSRKKHGGNYRKEVEDEEQDYEEVTEDDEEGKHEMTTQPPKRSRGRSVDSSGASSGRIINQQSENSNIKKVQSTKENVDVFANYDKSKPHGGNYREESEDNQEESALIVVVPSSTRTRVPNRRVNPKKEVEAFKQYDPKVKHGGNYRKESEKNLENKENLQQEAEDSKSAETSHNSPKESTVEVFADYDKTKKHGGNYRELHDQESQHKPVTKIVGDKKPSRAKKVERLVDAVPKPFAFYTDTKLADNVNKLKESTVADPVVEEIAEEVAETGDLDEEYDESVEDENYDEVSINFRDKKETLSTTTTTRKPPKIIKDPSKRLYYYASV